MNDKEKPESIRRAHDLYTAVPKRKKLGLNYDNMSPAERARIRKEITDREMARRGAG